MAGLEAVQKAAIGLFVRKLSSGEKILKTDAGLTGFQFRAMPANLTAEFFHVSRQSIHDWEKLGAPRNPDGTFDMYRVHQWLLERETEKYKKADSLKDKKLLEEIEKLKLANEAKRSEVIPKAEHVEKVRSWAASRNAFAAQIRRRNAHRFVGLEKTEQAEILLERMDREEMEIWADAVAESEKAG